MSITIRYKRKVNLVIITFLFSAHDNYSAGNLPIEVLKHVPVLAANNHARKLQMHSAFKGRKLRIERLHNIPIDLPIPIGFPCKK